MTEAFLHTVAAWREALDGAAASGLRIVLILLGAWLAIALLQTQTGR